MWVVLISTVASVLFLSFFLSNKITRPINLLTFAANKISNDEIAQDIKVKSNDEIGILATAFNKMAVNLKEREKKLKHITFHDSLTGIYNRAYYDEEMGRLNKDLHRFKPLSILSIDIDGLKMVNDTLGHDKGDSYLKTVANIIKAPFRTTDIVARTGGDEFCIALPNTSGKVAGARRDEIEKLIDKYNAKKPIISLSLSIGIATTKDIKDETIYNISQESDDDMYRYKLIHNVSSRSKVIDILSMALAERDFIAKGHAERLSGMSVLIADNINLPDGKKRDLLLLATVHDIGKIGISDKILEN
jgi:diguanylate cyclase (GGDEF)-like protein